LTPFWRGLGQESERISGLESENTALQAKVSSLEMAEHRRAELAAVGEYTESLAKLAPPHVPLQSVRTAVEARAHDPTIAAAWGYRNVDRAQANLALQQVHWVIMQQQRQPVPDTALIAKLTAEAQQLQIAVNARAILRQASLNLLKEFSNTELYPKPIDEEQTRVNADVSAAVRYGSVTKVPDEGPPDFSRMSDSELRAYTKQFGF
jgi:hypothetical protein